MKSLFVIQRLDDQFISMQLRVRCEEAGFRIALMVREDPPEGYEVQAVAVVRLPTRTHGGRTGGNGRKRALRIELRRTGGRVPIPKIREHFRPAWLASRQRDPVQSTIPSPESDHSPTP